MRAGARRVAVTRGGLAGGLTVRLALAVATGIRLWTLPETRGVALTLLSWK